MSVHYQGRLLDSGKDLVKSTRDLVTGCPVLFKLQKQDKNRALWEWEAGDEVYAIGVFHCHKEDHPRMGFPRVRWLNVERQVQQTVCFFFFEDRQTVQLQLVWKVVVHEEHCSVYVACWTSAASCLE